MNESVWLVASVGTPCGRIRPLQLEFATCGPASDMPYGHFPSSHVLLNPLNTGLIQRGCPPKPSGGPEAALVQGAASGVRCQLFGWFSVMVIVAVRARPQAQGRRLDPRSRPPNRPA